MGIKLVTDSTSYIPEEFINDLDIKVVSLNVIMDGTSRREVELKNETFYEEMDRSDEIPTSSQPSIEEVKSVFEEIVKNGDTVVGVFLSSKMSGTYSSAHLIKEMILEDYEDAKIEIIDSKSNCMQMGFAVVEGARAAKEGKALNEVVEKINHVINNSRFVFIPDTLKYLKKGGRIGGAASIVGTILQIKPVLTVQDGETSVLDKVRTKKKAIERMIKCLKDAAEKNPIGEVIVHHINAENEGLELANYIKSELSLDEVKIQSIGPIIGLHVGPGSIGIVYYTK
ncbi:MAG: DegV family protein [Clostridium sp.]